MKESKKFVQKIKKGGNLKTHIKLSGVHNYFKSIIRRTIYDCLYPEKLAPTLDSRHAKLSKIFKSTDYEFS